VPDFKQNLVYAVSRKCHAVLL